MPPEESKPQLKVLDPDELAALESMENAESYELISIRQFLNRVPNAKPWGVENVARFGALVTKFAAGFAVQFEGAVDPKIGRVQLFTPSLIETVYRHVQAKLRWPPLPEGLAALADPKAEASRAAAATLDATARTEKALEELSARVDSTEVLNNIQALIDYLRVEQIRLRQEIEAGR